MSNINHQNNYDFYFKNTLRRKSKFYDNRNLKKNTTKNNNIITAKFKHQNHIPMPFLVEIIYLQ